MNVLNFPLKSVVLAMLLCAPLAYAEGAAAQPAVEQPAYNYHASATIESLANSNAALYAEIIKDVTPIKTYLHQEQGYNIESGRFKDKKGNIGSIIIVSAQDGAVTVLYDLPEKHEIFTVSNQGKVHVIPTRPAPLLNVKDTIVVPQQSGRNGLPAPAPRAGCENIEMLVAYSTFAINSLAGVDPIAFAEAQLETVREGLRNSQVEGVTLSLGAVGIFNVALNYDTTGDGLSRWQTFLAPYRALYQTDINVAYAREQDNGGVAYVPGYTSSNSWRAPTAFRHELGHNVGGSHCNLDGSDNFRFGFNNGRSTTFLCGNDSPYYSTPLVNDDYGLPVGNARTADMARLWREQASRMASYNPQLAGEKLIFATLGAQTTKTMSVNTSSVDPAAGFVALSTDVGPTQLASLEAGGYTLLNVRLRNTAGQEHIVKFRAQRAIGGCALGAMNRNVRCQGGGPLYFFFQYVPGDNSALPNETYNGLLKLQAKDSLDLNFNVPINIPISVVKN